MKAKARLRDKVKAKKAAEFFLKEYFGTRYIDAGNGKAKVKFKKDTGWGKLCYYRCGDVFVLFETDDIVEIFSFVLDKELLASLFLVPSIDVLA